jgi:acid phosphatase
MSLQPSRLGRAAVAVFAVLVVIAGVAFSRLAIQHSPAPLPTPAPGSLRAVPAFDHIFVVVLENKGFDQVVGSPNAPYFNELIATYGLATGYRGLYHPSQPNYIALVSGSAQGIEDDKSHDIDAPNLFDQIEASGRDWRVIAEDVPSGCFTGETAPDGREGAHYARWHNPAISFRSIQGSPERCAKIQPLTAFDPAGADFQLIIPNLCHDMHDCPVAEGDRWLSQWIPQIIQSPAWTDRDLLVVTFDEPSTKDGDQRIATVVVGSQVPAGLRSDLPHTHYTLLRTIQAAWGLPCLEGSCAEGTLGEFFTPPG